MGSVGETYDYDSVLSKLEDLRRQADEVHLLLKSPGVADKLYSDLHGPDRLPNKQLSAVCSDVVDSLERVSLEISPSVSVLVDTFFAFLNTKALWTTVQAQVPDLLAEHGPQSAKELGIRSNIQPERLAQLLDTLANQGIFTCVRGSGVSAVYRNNRTSELLTTEHWTQWRLWSDLYGNDFFNVSRSMPDAVRIGEHRTAAQIEYKTEMNLFDYLAKEGLMGKFHKTLGAGAVAQSLGLAVDYPFEDIARESFIDIGGGSGAFLASILRAHPEMRGSLFDMSHVIEGVTPDFRGPGGKYGDVSSRVPELLTGDFTEAVPPSSVYTMKWCLHDWMDEDVVAVFKNVRRSIVETSVSRFLVFESVKQPGRSSRLPRYGDLIMMITCNGKERSREDWERLAKEGGWRIEGIHPIRRAWPCAIDMRPI